MTETKQPPQENVETIKAIFAETEDKLKEFLGVQELTEEHIDRLAQMSGALQGDPDRDRIKAEAIATIENCYPADGPDKARAAIGRLLFADAVCTVSNWRAAPVIVLQHYARLCAETKKAFKERGKA